MYLFGEIYFVFVSHYVIFNFYHIQKRDEEKLPFLPLFSFHFLITHESSLKSGRLSFFTCLERPRLAMGRSFDIYSIDFGFILTINCPPATRISDGHRMNQVWDLTFYCFPHLSTTSPIASFFLIKSRFLTQFRDSHAVAMCVHKKLGTHINNLVGYCAPYDNTEHACHSIRDQYGEVKLHIDDKHM